MKLPRSSGKPKKRKLLIIRRVQGRSMMPYLNPGQIVIGHGLFKIIKPDDVIIFEHEGIEKIKRVHEVTDLHVYVVGDNTAESSDSRQYGAIPLSLVKAKIIS